MKHNNNKKQTKQNAYRRKNIEAEKSKPYKLRIIKQTIISILFVVFALMIRSNQDANVGFIKNTMSYIVSENTNWQNTMSSGWNYIQNMVFNKPKMEGDDASFADIRMPSDGEILLDFGLETSESGTDEVFHYGLDFSGDRGDKIFCCADGVVEEIGYSDNDGKFIVIRHNNSLLSYYASCDEILPQAGDAVKGGQVIATMGENPEANTPHLHFEIREGETSLDPNAFLDLKRG